MKLVRHPDSPPQHDFAVEANVVRSGPGLGFRYAVSGGVGAVLAPAAGLRQRRDGLWRSTCFEAFVRSAGEAYAELNFAPQGEWAAYSFDDYRQGQQSLDVAEPTELRFWRVEREMGLEATMTLPAEFVSAGAPLALCAVIEDVDGRTSYWALAHSDGPPDFHHPDCFIGRLP